MKKFIILTNEMVYPKFSWNPNKKQFEYIIELDIENGESIKELIEKVDIKEIE